MPEEPEHKCFVCDQKEAGASTWETREALKAWEAEQLEKHGWYIHYVQGPNFPLGLNAHTHGLMEKFNHMDLHHSQKRGYTRT
jgi:hypothetical protein